MTAFSPAALAIADCIEDWWLRVFPNSGNCRVVVPAPTQQVGLELHRALLDKCLPSFFVTSGKDGSPSPSEPDRVLRADAVTSVRDGSFVVVVGPGELSKLQESIQGSGGGIRGLAVPDEWPWAKADVGFDFFDDFFPRWIRKASFPESEQEVAERILQLAIEATEAVPERARILFEEILGQGFDVGLGDWERADQFAMRVGLPSLNAPSNGASGIPAAGVGDLERLGRLVSEMEGPNAREAVEQNSEKALEELPSEDRPPVSKLKESLHAVLDKLRTSRRRGRGALCLRSALPEVWAEWRRLTLAVLNRVFLEEDTESALDVRAEWTSMEGVHVLPGKRHCIVSGINMPDILLTVERREGVAVHVEAKRGRHILSRLDLSPDETQVVLPVDWEAIPGGSVVISINVSAASMPPVASRVFLERPSETRAPFLAVVSAARSLDVKSIRRVDPDENSDSEESIDLDHYTSLFVASSGKAPTVMLDSDEVTCEVVTDGVRRLLVEPSSVAALGTQPEIIVQDDQWVISVPVTVEHKRGGACNLEVALVRALREGSRANDRCARLAEGWRGELDARPMLGSPDHDHEKRFNLVLSALESRDEAWRPVVLWDDTPAPVELRDAGWIQVAAHARPGGPAIERSMQFTDETKALVDRYSAARAKLFELIDQRHGSKSRAGLPLYAVAGFHCDPGDPIQLALQEYLKVFTSIQRTLAAGRLPWAEQFLLAHLDTVTVLAPARGAWTVTGLAIGPWHPLIVAKRVMVGRGLLRLTSISFRSEERWLRKLSTLLEDVPGIRWFAAVQQDSPRPVPFFVDSTDDPGWLIAHPIAQPGQFRQPTIWARELLGLRALREGVVETKGFAGYLADFMRAFPSRRSIVVKTGGDVTASEAAYSARDLLTNKDNTTKLGKLLPGGVHIVVDDDGGSSDEFPEWNEPVVLVYPRGGEGFQARHRVDMRLGQASSSLGYPIQSQNDASRIAPRGKASAAVLQMPLRTLEETASGVRDSRVAYNTHRGTSVDGLGEAFVAAVAEAQEAAGPLHEVGIKTLTSEIADSEAVWTILPGEGVDPAVLLEWTRSSVQNEVPKLLWDYRMAIAESARTYFVVSQVPKRLVHHLAAIKLFGSRERAGKALLELGSIGLALGSETFKSRSRALGVAGLIGASRVGARILEQLCNEDATCAGFLLPIDSFGDLLGGDLETPRDDGHADYRRADLVGVICRVNPGGVEMAFFAIESKFCGDTYTEAKARAALDQSSRSIARLAMLARSAREPDALAERLALARLLEFGLRLDPGCDLQFIGSVLSAVLEGLHQPSYLGATGCLVVSTEMDLEKSEVSELGEGVWVRLSPNLWPGETGDFNVVAAQIGAKLSPPWRARSIVLERHHRVEGRESPTEHSPAQVGSPDAFVIQADNQTVPAPEEGAEAGGGSTVPEVGVNTAGRQDHGSQADVSGAAPAESPVERGASEYVELLLGVSDDGHPITWRSGVNSNHNFMVTGSSGTGKTQLLKSVLGQARRQGLPALILDFKNDFASDENFLSVAGLDAQYVSFEGLPYNPLIPCPQFSPRNGRPVYQISQHINGIVGAFQRTYGLGEQQAADLRSSIRDALEDAGLPSSSIVEELPDAFPDFSAVGEYLRDRNKLAYNRLDPLFDLEIFHEKYRRIPFNKLLGRGYVLDLSGVQAEHIQNTLAMLLVYSAHRYLNALPHASTVKQLLVFDEAHRVLRAGEVEILIRECRAYGLGVVLSSQYPTDFSADTAANLATKILHGNGPDTARVQGIRSMLGLSEADHRLDMPIFHAAMLARPGRVEFGRTLAYPHWLLLDALSKGPKQRSELQSVKGVHGDRFVQALDHLVAMGLVTCAEETVRLAK